MSRSRGGKERDDKSKPQGDDPCFHILQGKNWPYGDKFNWLSRLAPEDRGISRKEDLAKDPKPQKDKPE